MSPVFKLPAQTGALCRQYCQSFSFVGLVVAALLFAASLTPSLLPRHFAVQGVLSGLALAVGYAVGVSLVLMWQFLELPRPADRILTVGKWLAGVAVAGTAVVFLSRLTVWQNSIRQLMELPPVETAYPWRVAVLAIATGICLVAMARALRRVWNWVDRQVRRVVPPRISYVASLLLVALAVLVVVNNVIARLALDLADAAFTKIDAATDDDMEQPSSPLASGSSQSLIAWDTIGIQGKRFVLSGPGQQKIGAFLGRAAKEPLRVYVGLGTRDTLEERAQLALEELKRVGGFQRKLLIVATPTGTGWLDPGAVDTVEYLHAGDTAIVSMQYSYLPSWITILIDPPRSSDSAQALFNAIYGHWTSLPADARPKLYLHGLSLGSLGSESSVDLFTIFEDPIQGGVWSGPPFPSTVWAEATRQRNANSPMWLPQSRDGSMLRFTGRESSLDKFGDRWGSMRFVYIQHASDPMTFFSPDSLYRRPDWLTGPRGPDVSPYVNWYPLVTFLQTGFDIPMATSVPTGYGHNYAPGSYLDAWIAVTDPTDWHAADTARWKQQFVAP